MCLHKNAKLTTTINENKILKLTFRFSFKGCRSTNPLKDVILKFTITQKQIQ